MMLLELQRCWQVLVAAGAGAGQQGAGVAGTANTGGGGGGAHQNAVGGNGGSGIVVVKELNKASGVWSMQSQFSCQEPGNMARVWL